MGEAHDETLDQLCLCIGSWWDADKPEELFAGYISRQDGQIELRLGAESGRIDHHLTERTTPIHTLCGKVAGRYVTAVDTIVTRGNYNAFVDSEVSHSFILEPQLLIIGNRHLEREQVYSGISFATNEAHKIFRLHPLKVFNPERDIKQIELREDARVTKEEVLSSRHALIEVPNLNGFDTDVKGLPGRFSYQYAGQRTWSRENGPSVTYAPRLLVEISGGGSPYRLMRKARHVAQLLSLVSLTPNYLNDFDLFILNGDAPESFRLYSRKTRRNIGSSDLSDFQVLVGFPKFSADYPALWNAWFSSMERHVVPRWIFQSTLEQEDRFDINRFLNVMQCLEILTNIYCARTKIDRKILDEFAVELDGLISGRERESDLKFLIAKMKEANRPPLSERLQDLSSRLDDRVLKWLLGDWRDTLTVAAQARNYFTHFGTIKDARREFYEENLAILTCKMTALYALIELQLMGIAPERFLRDVSLPWILRSAIYKQLVPT